MKQFFLLMALIICAAAVLKLYSAYGAGSARISPETAKERMDSGDPVIVLDVRTQSEFDEGHIPGAICLPNETIGHQPPPELKDLDAEILVYCRSGRRSAEAASKLTKLGYTNVSDFGGIIDWPYETTRE